MITVTKEESQKAEEYCIQFENFFGNTQKNLDTEEEECLYAGLCSFFIRTISIYAASLKKGEELIEKLFDACMRDAKEQFSIVKKIYALKGKTMNKIDLDGDEDFVTLEYVTDIITEKYLLRVKELFLEMINHGDLTDEYLSQYNESEQKALKKYLPKIYNEFWEELLEVQHCNN